MKLPGELTKEYETIASGEITTGQTIDIEVNLNKYDKIILELGSGGYSMNEGDSYIMEISKSGNAINKAINFYNYVKSTYYCCGFFYQNATNSFKLHCENCVGWPQRNYWLKGILK